MSPAHHLEPRGITALLARLTERADAFERVLHPEDAGWSAGADLREAIYLLSSFPDLQAVIAKWREKAARLKSGPSHGATRDYEDALCADEIKVCADELDALLAGQETRES